MEVKCGGDTRGRLLGDEGGRRQVVRGPHTVLTVTDLWAPDRGTDGPRRSLPEERRRVKV
ncbi:hypothetical protein E2C01_067152 [Portunus trituberculatus]|uniref:Uncharacterized protein n=1 Tax=Portunus trituberculatus TaxID=210409 RepID=A0A5B7HVT7_PORTR|nr:hypothetical protein [Portunus trituberculatus]